MGKKSKKLGKTGDQPQPSNVEILEEQDSTANDSTISNTKTKKKNRKRHAKGIYIEDTAEQIKNEVNEINATENSITTENTETKKKKTKKSKLLDENKKEIKLEIVEDEDHVDLKNKNKGNLSNGSYSVDVKPQIQNEQVKKKKKSKSKAKTGAPVLNDEESKVTEEEIDRFCDELDDEDNKQYEDWVKLLDARLSKKQPQNN